jgi:hypothetical protein
VLPEAKGFRTRQLRMTEKAGVNQLLKHESRLLIMPTLESDITHFAWMVNNRDNLGKER